MHFNQKPGLTVIIFRYLREVLTAVFETHSKTTFGNFSSPYDDANAVGG